VHPFQLSLMVAMDRAEDARRRAAAGRTVRSISETTAHDRQRRRVLGSLLRLPKPEQL
jgi:hypothetical protein